MYNKKLIYPISVQRRKMSYATGDSGKASWKKWRAYRRPR